MKTTTYSLRLLTPCFNGGASPNEEAELRIPSIRGKIRWWYRAATPGGQEEALFGGVAGNATRSSVAFRLSHDTRSRQAVAILPHKKGTQAGTRPALPPQDFDLISRCREETFDEVDRAVRLWVLLGTLGARGNRAAGSVWFRESAPISADALKEQLQSLRCPQTWDIRIAPVASFDEGRVIASDTVNGCPNLLGGINPRKDSPIKFKLIDLAGKAHLLMFAPQKAKWEQALDALRTRGQTPKPLTRLEWEKVL